MSEKNILVLGIGNLLLGDEGIGIHVVHHLKEMTLPANVELVDGGTGGFELIELFQGKKNVILIDAFLADAAPGSIFRLSQSEITGRNREAFTAHQTGLSEVFYHAQQMESPPEVIIYGIVPKDFQQFNMQLSTVLSRTIPQILDMVVTEINALNSPKLS